MASEEAARIIDLYQRKASDWIESRARTKLLEKPWLDRFGALLPPAGPILDLGCCANGRVPDRTGSSRRWRGFVPGDDRCLSKAFSEAGMDRRGHAPACLAAHVFRHSCVGQFLSPLPRRPTPDVSGFSPARVAPSGVDVHKRPRAWGGDREFWRRAAVSCQPRPRRVSFIARSERVSCGVACRRGP